MLLAALTLNLTDLIRTWATISLHTAMADWSCTYWIAWEEKNAWPDYIWKRPHYSTQAKFPAVKIERKTSVSLISSRVNSTILQKSQTVTLPVTEWQIVKVLLKHTVMGWKTSHLRILSCKNEVWNACCKTLKCCLDIQIIWLNSEQIQSRPQIWSLLSPR